MNNFFLKKPAVFVVIGFLFISFQSFGSERITRSDYIQKWKDVAIQNMQEFNIPASITLAQAILESGDGNSDLAKASNNHFGIKCHDWKGERVYYDDDEKGECFRKYKNASESFDDHSQFLKRKRYASLFELDIKNYQGWAKGLKKCGYATNPAYAKLLIGIIEKNDLHKYDKESSEGQLEIIEKNDLHKYDKESSEGQVEEINTKPHGKNDKTIPSSILLSTSRKVAVSENRIKFTLAKAGDTAEKIATELDLPVWTLRKYNDLPKNTTLIEGELIYLQPKRSRSNQAEHIVQAEESMRSISQRFGIKLKRLYKKNGVTVGAELKPGTKLILR
ncbi:MAG: glucosaminidase domain-containing protein [Flavobacteriales bacterium]|jgi:LysM repeat protein